MPRARDESSSQWWNREFDDEGMRIRSDVRQAAHDKWPEARNRVRVALGDTTEAAELMEAAVIHISRYLDRHHIPLFSYQNVSSLLMLHFRQELRRHVGRSRRVEPITEGNFDQASETENWVDEANRRIDLQRLCSLLSRRSCAIMGMRLLGRSWEKIGERLGISPYTARNSFWREVREAKAKIGNRIHPDK